ncbi:MAG: hypothetical protein ABSD20_17875, partial [Terriglobales bacterium]
MNMKKSILKSTSKTASWCKRDGHNRICLTCRRSIKTAPKSCASRKHQHSFVVRKAYQKSYFQNNKARLVEANRRYRRQHPEHKKWARQYGREWYRKNRDQKRAKNRTWEQRHTAQRRPYLREKALQWYYRHHQRAKASNRRWYQRNKVKKNSRRNDLLKAARARDPGIRVRYNLRTRLSNLIRRSGPKKFSVSRDVFLYTADQLRAHLESQFTPAMSWANYAHYWEIDHIQPCSNFDLTRLEECLICFALENLRPLTLQINRGR